MLIANKYSLKGKISNGDFGFVFKAENIRTGEEIALKGENIKSELKLLKNETKIYQYLQGEKGFPTLYWYGIHEDIYFMAIQLLGSSLKKVRETSFTFSLDFIYFIGIQMIERLEKLHSKGLIHRDIKPDNFLFGKNEKRSEVYLIDFGFCKSYVSDDGSHIPLRENRNMIGTPNFVSLNVHYGIETSRRDDLESVFYIMLYFHDMKYFDCKNTKEIVDFKKGILRETNFLYPFLLYCRNLKFDETPNYKYLKELLKK